MHVKKKQGFSKEEHLKSRKQIDSLFTGGKSFFVHPVKVFWHVTKADGNPIFVKAGVSASKRNFKKAVDRNRVKRLLRECYRLHKMDLLLAAKSRGITLSFFFIYIDKSLPTFTPLEGKIKTCLSRLQKIVEESS